MIATEQEVRSSVAYVFRSVHRARRDYHSRDRLLSLWTTWEAVRDHLACSVAEDVIHGYKHSLESDGERYRLALKRMHIARDRYLAHERGKLETAGPARVRP